MPPLPRVPLRLSSPAALAVLAVAAAARALAAGAVPIEDEAFVTFRYAANLAAGDGLVFNPGAAWEPVLGIASPGYAVALAALACLGLHGPGPALALNLVLDVASVALVMALLAARPVRALAAGLGVALLPELVGPSMAGVAAPLACALALGAAAAAHRGRFAAAGVLVGLGLTVRPEVALLLPGLALATRGRSERLLALLAPAAVLGALYLGTLRLVYGSPVPAPVAASVAGGAPFGEAVALVVRGALCPTPFHLPLAVLGVAGAVGLVRGREPLAPLVGAAALAVLLWLVVGARLSAAAHLLPLVALVAGAAHALAPLVRGLGRRAPALVPALACLVAAAGLAFGRAGLPEAGPALREQVWEPMAAWADEAQLARGEETLLASSAGAIGWFGGGIVLDLAGLTWSRRWHAGLVERLVSTAPEYLLLRARRDELAALRSVDRFSRAYYPIRRFSVSGETELEPELAELAEGDVSDYLLFRRRQ